MKKVIFIVGLVMICVSVASAETLYLKNGSKVSGKILEQTPDKIRIDISGIPITYYSDEIERVEGAAGVAAVPATPRASQPVSPSVQPPAAASVFTVPEVMPQREPALRTVPATPAASSAPPSKELVFQYLEASGTRDTLDETFQQMIESADPQVSMQLKAAYNLKEIQEVLVPVYQRYFTEDDLQKLLAFYQSPTARKVAQVSPKLMEDILDVTTLYFQTKIEPSSQPAGR